MTHPSTKRRRTPPPTVAPCQASSMRTCRASCGARCGRNPNEHGLSRSPQWALDAGLRPDRFPTRAASLLPGLLAATRTGLTSAGDDELHR